MTSCLNANCSPQDYQTATGLQNTYCNQWYLSLAKFLHDIIQLTHLRASSTIVSLLEERHLRCLHLRSTAIDNR